MMDKFAEAALRIFSIVSPANTLRNTSETRVSLQNTRHTLNGVAVAALVYIYMYIYIVCVHIYIYIQIYIKIYIYMHVHVCIYIYMYIYLYVATLGVAILLHVLWGGYDE